MRTVAGTIVAFALATIAQSGEVIENPRFCSASGEFCVVVRHYPRIGDFDRMPSDEYWRADPIDEWLAQYPVEPEEPAPPPEPARAAVYQRWPSGNQELLYELPDGSGKFVVGNDGTVVSYGGVGCEKDAELLEVRSPNGTRVRTILARDVFTRSDQLWLCFGGDAVRWSFDSTLQATVLVTDTQWDDSESRFASVEIDLTKEVLPAPDRDLLPTAVRVEAEPLAVLPPAIHQEAPEYPVVAIKARIAGTVRAGVVIGRDGTVQAVSITKPLPFGMDESVRVALLKWTFEPQPEPFAGEIAFRFEILRNRVVRTTPVICRVSE